MFKAFDETELLAMIEGELQPAKAETLRKRLAESHPRALEVLDRLRDDRELLRTAGEPAVPADLLAELEPLIARPMLMPPPGQLRRRYRRRRQRRAWIAVSAAAGLTLALVAGIWALAVQLTGIFGGGPPEATPGELARAPETTPAETPRAVVTAGADEAVGDPVTVTAVNAPAPRVAVGEPQAVSFSLVLAAGPDSGGEAVLTSTLDGFGDEAALVRNLTLAEAQRLTDEWHQRRIRNGSGTADHHAGTGSNAPQPKVDDGNGVRPPLPLPRGSLEALESEQLYGPKPLAASFEQQIELSERGATHTVSIRLSVLSDLLARLSLEEGASARLAMLDDGDAGWLGGYAGARAEIERLHAEYGDVLLYLPVVID